MRAQSANDRLNRIEFHLFGEQKSRRMQAQCRRLEVLQEPPEVAEVPRGILAAEINPDGKVLGARGVCDASGSILPASIPLRGKQVRGKREAPGGESLEKAAVDGRIVCYIGDLRHHNAHYGHFLLEILSRAWQWAKAPSDCAPVLLGARLPDFARAMYGLIPGLGDKISLVSRTTRFERIIVPAPAFILDRQVHTQFKQLCNRMAAAVVGGVRETTEQPVYLSRAGLDPTSRRTILGEENFEQFLSEHGFLIVRPENLPIPEQIRLFNRHRNIVATMGSACHNRIFSLSATDLVVLASERFNANYVLCDILNAGSTRYVHALFAPDIPGAAGLPPYAAPLMLNIDNALDAMKKFGLLPESVHFPGARPGLEEYKARWVQIAMKLSRRSGGGLLRDAIGRVGLSPTSDPSLSSPEI